MEKLFSLLLFSSMLSLTEGTRIDMMTSSRGKVFKMLFTKYKINFFLAMGVILGMSRCSLAAGITDIESFTPMYTLRGVFLSGVTMTCNVKSYVSYFFPKYSKIACFAFVIADHIPQIVSIINVLF